MDHRHPRRRARTAHQNKASQYSLSCSKSRVAEPTTTVYGDWKERAARDALAPVIDKANDTVLR
ncbi:hypothetical protein [Rhodococcus sp. SBT000017]|uniref:hypothetical protein n=1 Tax=Rhodococcus sp. SBT000017 TaxID=1803385 RepID=UPI0011C38E34|nr:hypothetical protein [Rhodococcus sp. SBT000017]